MAEFATTPSENVLMRAGQCLVTVLPRFGGKIASIKIGERELLQQPLAPIASRSRTMAFDESDASGWDECLPSVAACHLETPSGTAEIPDHGDLWRVEWQPVSHEAHSVTYRADCFSLPLRLERSLSLTEQATGWMLSLNYSVTNLGLEKMPWSWAAHPLFAVEEGDRIALPSSITSVRLEGSGGARLGQAGDTVAWPMARLADGRRVDPRRVDPRVADSQVVDLRVVEPPHSGTGDKLFAGPLHASENWCALDRPSAGVRIRVTFDARATPYLGLWICYGGWPERPELGLKPDQSPKQMCVAMEPATAPVDSLAATGPWSRQLAPGDCFSWPMDVEIERIEMNHA